MSDETRARRTRYLVRRAGRWGCGRGHGADRAATGGGAAGAGVGPSGDRSGAAGRVDHQRPGQDDRRSTLLRGLSIAVVGVLVLDALASTAMLIAVLIAGGEATNSADALLAAGAGVWLSNMIACALLYWELDGGGAASRAHHMPLTPDLAFPQQLNPQVASPNWRPRFIDYLYLGLTASTAFSPTDVMPLAPWAKDRHGDPVARLARRPGAGCSAGSQRVHVSVGVVRPTSVSWGHDKGPGR